MKRSVVLLSGGLDSTVNLFAAKLESEIVLALTFDYGQRSTEREQDRAKKIACVAGVEHRVVHLPWFAQFTQTSLVNHRESVPTGVSVAIDDLQVSKQSAEAVWVPNRNGIFLNIAAGFAEGLGAQWVVPGFNVEEAATFADNSKEFMKAMDLSLSFSTRNSVVIKGFTDHLTKTEIVGLGKKLGVPLDLVWPCYYGGETPCGECESCQRWQRALRAAGHPRFIEGDTR